MLEYLRNAADKPVAKILMGVLIFSFVGWGVAEWVFGLTTSDTTLMRVGDEKISIQQYSALKSNELAAMSRTEQRELYTNPGAMTAFQNRVVSKLASMRRINRHAHDLGYVVSDKQIANNIRAIPQFHQDGKFSAAAFDAVLRNSGLTESDVATDLRFQGLRNMVTLPITTPVAVPRFVKLAAYNARNVTRNVDIQTVKFSDFKTAKPTTEQLREFYAQHPHRVPESRDVSYVLVAAAMDKPDEYEHGFKTAQKLEDDIIAGDSMDAVAKKYNAKFVNYKNVSGGKIPSDKIMNNEMIARIFDMDAGMESELIETKEGFVIVRVDKITPEHNAEFDSVKSELSSEWTREQQRTKAYLRANELLTELNKNGKLAKSKRTKVTRTNGAPMAVLVAAFKHKIGENIIADDQDAFYVVHLADEKLPKVDDKELNKIKTDMETMSMRHIGADYDAYLEREYPTKINEKTFNRFVR